MSTPQEQLALLKGTPEQQRQLFNQLMAVVAENGQLTDTEIVFLETLRKLLTNQESI